MKFPAGGMKFYPPAEEKGDGSCTTCSEGTRQEDHVCPFDSQVYGNNKVCNCCKSCERNCELNI